MDHQSACHAKCQFSRGTSPPQTRTHNSACCQVGNAMHINCIGGCHLLVVLALSKIGKTEGGTTSSGNAQERGPRGRG
eukprot:13125225-Alexandrium_andersonii.AAC.1